MNICHIMFLPGFGGAQKNLVELCNAQCEAHDVTLITQIQGEHNIFLRHLDPRVRYIEMKGPFFLFPLWLMLQRLRPDIIHTHLGRAGRRAQRLRPLLHKSVKLISTIHWNYKDKCYGNHDAIIAITDTMHEELSGKIKPRLELVPYWIGEPPSTTPAPLPHVTPEKFHILCGGRFDDNKGFDILIQAFRQAQLDNASLTIFGDGAGFLWEQYKGLAAGHPDIHFTGYRDDFAAQMHNFHLFVMPSRVEPFGLCLAEAMQAGCQVLSSASVGGQAMLANHPECLYEIYDTQGLTTKLRETYDAWDGGPPQKKTWDVERFKAAPSIKKIEDLYQDLLGIPHVD